MARGFQGAVLKSLGARDHRVTVVGTELLAPHFLRVRMTSPTLFQDTLVFPTAWLRLWFPDPDGSDTEFQRGYTLSEADPDAGTFAVDFVLHQPAGPASTWALNATAGQSISATSLGARKFEVPTDPPAGYLLIGDSASIPGINGILDAVPAELPIELYLELHDENDRLIPLGSHPRLRVHWVPRQGPTSLAAALEARDWSDWYAWLAPESGSLKHLRTRLKDEFGFPKSETYGQAYWIHGKSMGKRRGDPPDAAPAAPPAVEPPPAPAVPAASRPGTWQVQAGGRLLHPLKRTFVAAGILQALITLVELAPYVLLVELSRRLLAGEPASALWPVGIWAVVLLGSGTLLSSALLLWLHGVDARFSRELRQRLLGTMARVPLGWFSSRGSGSVKKLVQDDTLALHYLVTHAVPDAVAAVVAPLAVLGYLFSADWVLALVLLIPVLAYVVTLYAMVIQSGSKVAQAQEWSERMSSEAAAYLEGQPVIRVFGGAAASGFRRTLEQYLVFLNDWQRPFIGKKMVMDLSTRPATFLALIAAFGTLLVTTGSMEPIDLLPFLLLGTGFGARLLGIGYGLSGLRDGRLAARRLQVALDEPVLTTSPGDDRAADPAGRVVLRDVCFGYRPGVPVLQQVSLTLEPGTVTALVGPSGSGKSTLAALLARFHDVDTGSITVGGRDLRTLTADELYTAVGFVLQETQLVHGTVRENIALAVPDATAEQVVAAATAAALHDRILELPDGYDTVLGPEQNLSGGERQRLTIARALLADTPVLVLDEATAFADPESEFLVQQALSRLTAGRTVLVIAHRLHTVTEVDRIVVLDHGRIVESGTHPDLLAADGRYAGLFRAGVVPETAR